MITTTLNRIHARGPCQPCWKKLLNYLGKTEADDEPLPYATILESNGLKDALWVLGHLHPKKSRLLAVRYARRVQHLMKDPRSLNALDAAEKYVKGEASDEELAAAATAAASAIRDAAGAAAGAAAEATAEASAWAAAWAAASAWAAAAAETEAWEAAWAAAGAAAETEAWAAA